jgi:hypothetical protein
MDILYYSNFCKHSQKLVTTLVKGNLSDKVSFICIDKRMNDTKTNHTYILLENGSKVILPQNINSVPSLLLVKQQYRVICGCEDIMKHYHPALKTQNEVATDLNGEPLGYHVSNFSGNTNIISEQYTLYSLTPEELSTKGKGGNRQMYNYVPATDDMQFINTPADTYRPDKISNSVTIDILQQQRMDEIGHVTPKRPLLS